MDTLSEYWNKSFTSTLTATTEKVNEVTELHVSTASEVSSIQHPALFETNRSLAIAYIVVMGFALFIGIIGNFWILASACIPGSISKIGKEFIINLALADICVTGVADPMCILGVMKGESFFNDKPIFCEIVAAMCLTACFCAFMSLSMLTFNRYIYLCHNELYDRLYNPLACVFMCLVCWVLAFLFEFPNFIGWGDHTFDKKNHQCIWDRNASQSYSLFVSLGLIGVPLLSMGTCYVLIFIKIWNSKKSVYKLNYEDPLRMIKAWKETVKSSRTLFVLFTVFVVCWTPYATVIAIDINDNLTTEVHLFVTLLAHLHSSCNFVVYMICSKRFRRNVISLMGCSKSYYHSQDKLSEVSGKTIKTDDGISPTVSTVSKKMESNNEQSTDRHM